jgi:hypothetical protein
VGLPQWVAEAGAGAAQVMDHWKHPQGNLTFSPKTYFDDPADNYWIKFGYYYGQSQPGKSSVNDFTNKMKNYMTNNGKPPDPLGSG